MKKGDKEKTIVFSSLFFIVIIFAIVILIIIPKNIEGKSILDFFSFLRAPVEEPDQAEIQAIQQAKLLGSFHLSSLEMMLNDPDKILRTALPKEFRDKLPAELQDSVEERITTKNAIEGTLDYINLDYKDKTSEDKYYLNTNKGTFELVFVDKKQMPLTGSRIKVDGGVKFSKYIVLNAKDAKVTYEKPAETLHSNVALILFKTQDVNAPNQPSFYKGVFFTNTPSVKSFIQENSFGITNLVGYYNSTGDVYGWITVPFNSTDCNNMWNQWYNAAIAIAQTQGFDWSHYDKIQAIMPEEGCSWWGLGYIGGVKSIVQGSYVLHVAGHEFIHTLSARDASTYSCFIGSTRVSISNTCTETRYADPFTIMAQTDRHLSVGHKVNC
jgi:hypothetical protein